MCFSLAAWHLAATLFCPPMTALMALMSAVGPAMRDVPVSAMAWQPDAHCGSCPSTPRLSILNCQ